MPKIVDAEEMSITRSGEGWHELTLADAVAFGAEAMVASRLVFAPHAQGGNGVHDGVDQLLYVIRGSGQAMVDGTPLALERESMLWLEQGESYYFVAGDKGLEILRGYPLG